jgi:hypothetical protein
MAARIPEDLAPQRPENALLVLGVVLLLLPLFFVVVFPEQFRSAQLYLRIVASLGGALVGAWLPGFLRISVPGVKGAGALAILVLFFQFNPPQALNDAVNPESTDSGVKPTATNGEISAEPAPERMQNAEPKPLCAFVSIKALGWKEGHKTNFCKANAYEHGNFNQGEYKNGGICITGTEPSVCRERAYGTAGQGIECKFEGNRTVCYRK